MNRASEPFVERVNRSLDPFAADRGFSVTGTDDRGALAGWVRLESATLVIDVIRDRGVEWIEVAAKERPRPRARRRPWPLGHVVAYLDGEAEPYPVSGLEIEAGWLTRRAAEILDPTLLNSDDLNRWAVKASRRRSGPRRGT